MNFPVTGNSFRRSAGKWWEHLKWYKIFLESSSMFMHVNSISLDWIFVASHVIWAELLKRFSYFLFSNLWKTSKSQTKRKDVTDICKFRVHNLTTTNLPRVHFYASCTHSYHSESTILFVSMNKMKFLLTLKINSQVSSIPENDPKFFVFSWSLGNQFEKLNLILYEY